jgi:transposase
MVSAEVDWGQFTALRVLGVDEISLLKGQRDFVTIVSALDKNCRPVLLAVLKGREKQTLVDFLRTIPEALRESVEQVCADLYEGFVNAVKEVLPQAQVVADRFHVAQLYREAFDELRKLEMKELKAALKPDEYKAFKGVLWVLRRNYGDLSPEELQQLELLFECSPLLGKAYRLREKLYQIFATKQTKESAQAAFCAWIKQVQRSGLTCFDKFITTLETWMNEITNYFLSRFSSGWVEGLNNKIKVLKRRCYGIKNIAMLFRRISLDLSGYEKFAH